MKSIKNENKNKNKNKNQQKHKHKNALPKIPFPSHRVATCLISLQQGINKFN